MLQKNYTALVNLGTSLPHDRAAETTIKFVALANEIRPHFSNWSKDGFLQMSKRISSDARSDQHLDKSSAIAKGLVAVWVECHARNHPVAELIKIDLDNLIEANSVPPALSKPDSMSTPIKDLINFVDIALAAQEGIDSIDYGYKPHDPILCRDIMSSKLYLFSLRHEGRRVTCERYGSVIGPSNRVLDHYGVSDSEGYIADLYVDAHAGSSASWRAPYGFTLSDTP